MKTEAEIETQIIFYLYIKMIDVINIMWVSWTQIFVKFGFDSDAFIYTIISNIII